MRVAVYTLGCKVNLYESELMMNKFIEKGYILVDFKEESDIYIINSCTVTNNADIKTKKAINTIKKNHSDSILVLVGCYPQVNKDSIFSKVDIVLGNRNKSRIVEIVEEYLNNNKKIKMIENIDNVSFEDMSISDFNTKTRAFVKIQDGCNNYCAYCIIPYSRGNIRSKEMGVIIDEVTNLVNKGYKEVVLTGIHTGHYGKEKGKYDLSDVLINLNRITNLKRIRLSSIEITEIDDRFLNCLRDIKIIANHLHIPVQSGCNKTLSEMLRKYDIDFFKEKINKIRSIRPDISITTDVIVGFPNETDDDFLITIKNVKEIGFSKLHVFPYSKRNGTVASNMENQVSDKIKKERSNILNKISINLELKYMNSFINKTLEMIPEGYKDGYLTGHTSNYLLAKTKGDIEELNQLKTIIVNKIDFPYILS